MLDATPLEPWDDDQNRVEVLKRALDLPRWPLVSTAGPRCPGAYLFFLVEEALVTGTGDTFDTYLPALAVLATGQVAFYCGSASEIADRMNRYRSAWRTHERLLSAIRVAFYPTSSEASALMVERHLITTTSALGQKSAFGSKRPGSGRPGGTRRHALGQPGPHSLADALFWPGRYWTKGVSGLERASAQLYALGYLARLKPDGPRWPPCL